MPADNASGTLSRKRMWVGRVVSAIPVLLLLFSAGMKLAAPAMVSQQMAVFGYPASHTIKLGIVELLCTILYAIPQTSVLGAILLTGYLGGATATHARIGDPFYMPILLGVVLWLGLWLREGRLVPLLPIRK